MARSILGALAAAIAIVVPLMVAIVALALEWPTRGLYVAFAPVVAAFAVVGWLLVTRRPENVIGPLCLAFALVFTVYFPVDAAVRFGEPQPIIELLATFSSASDAPAFIIVAMILLLFPDGQLPGPRWRWAPILAVAGSASAMIGFTLNAGSLAAFPSVENPLGIPGFPGAVLGELGYLCLIALLIGAVAALLTRWRRGTPMERAQVKWMGAAALVFAVAEAINLATFDTSDPLGSPVAIVLAVVATALIPIAIGIAILRYRLYEIDRIISRTIGWAVVTGLLVAIFAAGVVALQAVLSSVTQGATIAVAAATLIAFALFQPLRRRVQRVVDRRFDRARYDGERVVAEFTSHLRDRVDLDGVAHELHDVIERTVRPASATVWVRPVTDGHPPSSP